MNRESIKFNEGFLLSDGDSVNVDASIINDEDGLAN